MRYSLSDFRGDLFGGITATVVALPVALAFGVASGLGAAAGLYGAIAVGFWAPMFGGTRSQISGPTAPITVAMAVIVTSHSSTLAEAFTIVIMAGTLQVLLGLSGIGRFVAYTPHVVVSGFMSGIGIIVMLMQTLPFLGAPISPGGAMGAIRMWPELSADINTSALIIALITLAVGVLWPRVLARHLPAPVVALVVGTLLGVLWFADAPTIGSVPTGLPALQFELPSASFMARAFEPAVILALLGSVDSLLISLVADSLTGTRHNANRELVGQGVGNIFVGLFGGPRYDHAVANLYLLTHPSLRQIPVWTVDGWTALTVLNGDGISQAHFHGQIGDYVSITAVSETVTGITTVGLKWPLTNATFRRGLNEGTSNELINDRAMIQIESGIAFVSHHFRAQRLS